VTPLPAVQANETVELDKALPGAGLVIVGCDTPVPLKLTTVEVPVEELLVMVSEPEAAPAVVGSNCTVSVAV
jgi:hypothetical protein